MLNVDSANKTLKKLTIALTIVSFLGFVDAAYLSVTRYYGATVPCTVTHACEAVLHSQYSTLIGIPVVALGVLYYLAIFFGGYAYLEFGSKKLLKLAAALTVGGLLTSAWLVYVQLELLHAICQYCMLSALTSTILFILGMLILRTFALSRSPSVNVQE